MPTTDSTPAHVRLVLTAANSYDAENRSDAWETPSQLTRWLREHAAPGRFSSSAKVSDDEHVAAVRLRDGLRTALLERREPAFGELAKPFPLRLALDDGEPQLLPADDNLAGEVGRVLAAVARSAFDGTWERIKICPADDCRVAFFDQSRNRSRSWCSMQVCGNRTKTRTYRARHPQG
ncbi:MAG: CGNR zinc finger domain-containing protein [Mycobacterium sp.]